MAVKPAKPPEPSRLQGELAHRILQYLKAQDAKPGFHLVETDLCAAFGVSRTPVRGALQVLAAQGWIKPNETRGMMLAKALAHLPDEAPPEDDEDHRLFAALAAARDKGALPDQFTQQELVRRTHAGTASVLRVLRQLADLGLVERKPGNGWAFGTTGDTA